MTCTDQALIEHFCNLALSFHTTLRMFSATSQLVNTIGNAGMINDLGQRINIEI